MIPITKEEAKIIRRYYPDLFIPKTRHKQYLTESIRFLKLLPKNDDAAALLRKLEKEEEQRLARRRVAEEAEAMGGN